MTMRATILLLFTAALLSAGTTLTFDPPGANIKGHPTDLLFWNFEFTNSVNFLLVSQVDYITLSGAGVFTDLFSAGAPVIGPGDSVPGTSSYKIDLLATPGFVSSGVLLVTYDEFSVSPNDPSFDPGIDTVALGETAQANASVEVLSPEPATFGLLLPAVGALLFAARRMKQRHADREVRVTGSRSAPCK